MEFVCVWLQTNNLNQQMELDYVSMADDSISRESLPCNTPVRAVKWRQCLHRRSHELVPADEECKHTYAFYVNRDWPTYCRS
jgi:hypothetical protein